VLSLFHPLVARWFEQRFGTPTEPQAAGWPAIQAGDDTLISSPTGSGKTLAAFLACVDRLIRAGLTGPLPDETQVVYVSPLKALGNDIEKNLQQPLAELRQAAEAQGLRPPDVRVAVRTGDTAPARRQAMIRRPPHILVTTPESLYILLTSTGGRALLATTRTVIVDEIHAVARDKRGAHLALSLERLEALTTVRPQRIGLSATQNPIEELARFLVGAHRVAPDGTPRCTIVEVGRRRTFDLALEVPRDELSSVASNDLWSETYDRIAELVREHRTTLVFANTRRLVERATHALADRLGAGAVAAHHGSLARSRRLDAEERLKSGALRAVVATASLELGIDVGSVDLAVQLGSPQAINVGLQRLGRAGHWRGAVPKARFFPMSRDELLECAALLRAIRAGRLELTSIPRHPLDVLAQQIVAEAASGPQDEDALFERMRRAWPYRSLPRAEFDQVIAMLAEGITTRRGRSNALLHRDGVHHVVRGRRGAGLAALTGAGAIPDNSQYKVVAEPDGVTVGHVDEDFAVESMAGEIFLLGNTSWRIRRIEPGVVRVEDAQGAPPGVPFWRGEAPGRSGALSAEVSMLREELEARLPDREEAIRWLATEGSMPEAGARQAVDYLAASRAVLSVLPTQKTLVAERFFDEAGGMQLVIHAPFGARQNRAFGLALRKRFCRTFDFELQAAATDDGVLLSLGPQHSFPLESIFEFVSESTAAEVLTQAALQAPMFQVRWRWVATRALALPRMLGGKRVPPAIARMRAEDLLAAVFPQAVGCQDNAPGGPIELPDHPLVTEAMRDCLHEAMDLDGLHALLARIRAGEVRLVARDTAEPSPMSHEIVGARPYAYLDDAPLEERRARAVAMRRSLPAAEAGTIGALDPEAVAEVASQVWPVVRDPEELHDALLDLGILPAGEASEWQPHFDALTASGRAALAVREGQAAWVAAERIGLAQALGFLGFPGSDVLRPRLEPLPSESLPADAEEAAVRVVRGWISAIGPVTADRLSDRLGLPRAQIVSALARLEAEGFVLRGSFLPGEPWTAESPHWCERSILARIHRLTLGRLRREIEPVSAADFLRFLFRWQHVQPGTKLHGPRGLAEVLGQLQGFQAAAGAWERELLPARVTGYDPAWLDQLCLAGEVAWGRPSPGGEAEEAPRRRNAPTRNAPIALMRRSDLAWLLGTSAPLPPALGPSAQALVDVLARSGACFASDLALITARLPGELERALWELVSAGLVTNDLFAGLRALVEPQPRQRRRPNTPGRWALLRHPGLAAPPDALEQVAGQYLARYGVVFRDLLARESAPPPWRELLGVYRRQEAQGLLRGGRFVSGFTGEQFARPEAIDALRAVRRTERDGAERVELSASDPLNLVGVLTPGARISAVIGNRVAFVDGVPVPPVAGRRHLRLV
jgi:ATP-dependent Lhr-like helicase